MTYSVAMWYKFLGNNHLLVKSDILVCKRTVHLFWQFIMWVRNTSNTALRLITFFVCALLEHVGHANIIVFNHVRS